MTRRALPAALLALLLVAGAGAATASASSSAGDARHAGHPALHRSVLPAHPRVYFFGDSWTNGATAAPGRGFPQVVGETLGWTVELGPDNSGAGYVHTFDSRHALFPERAAALPRLHADLVVLEGGLNDAPGPLTHLSARIEATIRTLRAKAGGAPLVLVGPAFPDGTVPEGIAAIDRAESRVARRLGVHYVSPVRERWFTPANVSGLVDPATFHPDTAGHAYYAGRLVADLQRFVRQKSERTAEH